MGIVTADGIATEYMRLIDEGWTPDIEEFLHHVPEELREESRQRIVELTSPPVAPEELPTPVEELVEAAAPVEETMEAPVEVDLFAEPEVTGEVKEVVEAVDNPPEFEAIEETEPVVEELEPEPEPEKPVGMVKLSREEAKAMFAAMEAKKATVAS